MRHNVVIIGLAVATLLVITGCCEPAICKPGAPEKGMPPLLADSSACPTSDKVVSTPLPRCSTDRQGEKVYQLDFGVVSNTNAARAAGGATRPMAICLPGGIAARCPNPLPQVYLDAVKANRAVKPEAKATAPVAPPTAVAWEPSVANSGYCPPAVCEPHPDTAIVCKPEYGCFTLPVDESGNEPAVIVPQATSQAFPVAPSVVPETREAPRQEPVSTSPRVPTTESIPEIAIPADSATSKYEVVLPVAEPATEDGGKALRPVSPPSLAAPAPASTGSSGNLLPIPEITDIETGRDAAPTPSVPDTSSLPGESVSGVKLPPSLN